jgi:hypothetical protein
VHAWTVFEEAPSQFWDDFVAQVSRVKSSPLDSCLLHSSATDNRDKLSFEIRLPFLQGNELGSRCFQIPGEFGVALTVKCVLCGEYAAADAEYARTS